MAAHTEKALYRTCEAHGKTSFHLNYSLISFRAPNEAI